MIVTILLATDPEGIQYDWRLREPIAFPAVFLDTWRDDAAVSEGRRKDAAHGMS